MESMIGHQTESLIDPFEDLTPHLETEAIREVRQTDLTSRDIEADVLRRLGRLGYDWSGTRGRRRKASGLGRRLAINEETP